MTSVLDRAVGFVADRLDRRSFLGKAAVVGSAVVAAPLEFGLKPRSAYAAVCNCSGSACACGAQCCDGYTEFCCTLNGVNACPPGTITAGWWKVDGSQFCGGAARYYLDCNSQCGPCGCGSNGVCSGSCSGTGCGCAGGNCGNRKTGCTRFRYGQCNQHVRCVGPIVCRVVTCSPPWSFDPSCTTSSRTDNATRYHHRQCLQDPFGGIDAAADAGGAIRLTGWAVPGSSYDIAGVRTLLDSKLVYHGAADLPRPDVQAAYPAVGLATGYDVTVTAPAGRQLVCVWGVDRSNGNTAMLGMREVDVAPPFGQTNKVIDKGAKIQIKGWAIANSAYDTAGVRIFLDSDFVYHGAAEIPRPDVKNRYPQAKLNSGFDVTVPAAPGRHLVCAWAVDRRNGSLTLLSSQEFDVSPMPFGRVETITNRTDGTARVAGWVIDPGRPGTRATVRVLVDGREIRRFRTDRARPDVVAGNKGAPAQCGFDLDVPMSNGTHQVCVEALSIRQRFHRLSCHSVTVTGGA